MRIRYTLFSGCCSVKPKLLTCTPYLNLLFFGFLTPYLSLVISSHKSTNARILHISVINLIPELTKKLILPTTFSNSSEDSTLDSFTLSKYATAVDKAKANS